MNLRHALALCFLATVPLAAQAQRPGAIPLDGRWEFRFAPDDRGLTERWFAPGTPFERPITVPGCWDTQGVGAPTDKMRHNAIGVGWYRRGVALPHQWQGKRVWLHVGGVHRSARVWVNGQPVGEHLGYPVAFRLDITAALNPRGPQQIVLAVDSRKDPALDPLMGAYDGADYMDLTWGGIQEPIRLEATGDPWIDDAFAQPDPAHSAATLQVTLGGRTAEGPLEVAWEVRRATGGAPLAQGSVPATSPPLTIAAALPGAPLWTPESPNLLVAELTLRRGAQVLDRLSVRFGLRKLEATPGGFVLNGSPFFLRGYGDDYTFPLELCAPGNVSAWRAYLQRRKAFGFNGVRHHSTMLGDSYLTAADEVGILVQPELPIVYQPFFDNAPASARALYARVWEAYIRQMRNHPSVMAWCMGNELYNGLPMGPEFHAAAKRLDPTRPVIDSDGVPAGATRPTLDYHSIQFDEWSIPWGATRAKYAATDFPRPVIIHEMSNISTLPDPAEIPRYNGIIRPFWLEQMRDAVTRRGLQSHLPAMLQASARLQTSLLKLNLEAARLSPNVDGFHQWLFRDYWTGSTGFVNQFDQIRALSPAMARQFNSPAVLLWDHDRVSFRPGEEISLRLYLSDFRPADAPPLRQVTVRLGESRFTLTPPAEGLTGRGVIGPWTGALTAPAAPAATKLTLQASCGPVRNDWPLWVFPQEPPTPEVLVASTLTDRVLSRLAAGASVLLTGDSGAFPTLTARLKPAWWKGNDSSDHSYGNLFTAHPALRGFPHDGYGDLQAYRLLDSRPVVLLDDVPGGLEPIIWCLDVPWRMAPKAYLFEARVGRGRLLVSTMDLSPQARRDDPAAACMYASLTRYVAGDDFRPTRRLPMSWLRQRVARFVLPDMDTWVEGYARLLDSTAASQPWHSYREDNVDSYPVRPTDGTQRITWQTAPVPAGWKQRTVTFVWAGGIGWRSQPDGGDWALTVNGHERLRFAFTTQSARWSSPDDSARLSYVVRRSTNEDTFGLFMLTLSASELTPGRPIQLSLSAPTAANSRRWASLVPYTDVVATETAGQ